MCDAGDRLARRERVWQAQPLDPCEVGLHERELAKLPSERGTSARRLAEGDQPRRAAAEPMRRSGRGARDVARTHELEQRAGLEWPRGEHLQARGLDDDEHVLVLERDVEMLRRLGLSPWRAVELELVADSQLVVGCDASTVHEHASALDRLAPRGLVRVPEARDVVSEHGVARVRAGHAASINIASIRAWHARIVPRRDTREDAVTEVRGRQAASRVGSLAARGGGRGGPADLRAGQECAGVRGD